MSTVLDDPRVAIVTGAAGGLGRAEALALAEHGAAVVVNDLDPAVGETAEMVRAAGGRAHAVTGDVADAAVAGSLVDQAIEQFGGLDAVVNNAGIVRDRMIFSMSEQEWDSVVRVHLRGTWATLRRATAYWRAESKAGRPRRARVVNTASEAALTGAAGQSNYAAAKAGIIALTVSTARACEAYGVRVNAICPRARTAMVAGVLPDAAPGETDPYDPAQVTPLVAYLASPAAEGVNGQVFVVHSGKIALLAPPQVADVFRSDQPTWDLAAVDAALSPRFATPQPGYSAKSALDAAFGA